MALSDVYNLSTNVAFQQRVQSAIVAAAVAIVNEVANDVQTITTTGNPTGGTFTLTWQGQTTSALAFNASAGAIHAALQALSNIGQGQIVGTGGPLPTGVSLTFTGTLAGYPQVAITHTDSLTGGSSPAVVVTHTTFGVAVVNHAARAALASKVLANPTGYGQLLAVGVASDTTVQADYTGGNLQTAVTDAHITNAVSGQWNAYS